MIKKKTFIRAVICALLVFTMMFSSSVNSQAYVSAKKFRRQGVVRYAGYKWTWYSQRVLPGGGLKIPGRHVDKNGYVCDKNGYIVLASRSIKKHKVIKTPFGKRGRIYDYCPSRGIIDVYTNF